MCCDARRLIGQLFCRIGNFGFKRDLVPNVTTILDLLYLPNSFCHINLLTDVFSLKDVRHSIQ